MYTMFKVEKKRVKLLNNLAYTLAFFYTVTNILLRDSNVGSINDRKIILAIGIFLGIVIVVTEIILYRFRKKGDVQ